MKKNIFEFSTLEMLEMTRQAIQECVSKIITLEDPDFRFQKGTIKDELGNSSEAYLITDYVHLDKKLYQELGQEKLNNYLKESFISVYLDNGDLLTIGEPRVDCLKYPSSTTSLDILNERVTDIEVNYLYKDNLYNFKIRFKL